MPPPGLASQLPSIEVKGESIGGPGSKKNSACAALQITRRRRGSAGSLKVATCQGLVPAPQRA